jgi:hypothetical protein
MSKGMKTLFSVLVSLLVLLMMGGCATGKYVPRPNEELYGTWINEKSVNAFHIQKWIISSSGMKEYSNVSASLPVVEGEPAQIDRKWTDSEGNIWYRSVGTIKRDDGTILVGKTLLKLSKSATVLEAVNTIYDPNLGSVDYPTEINPKPPALQNYYIFYRAGE